MKTLVFAIFCIQMVLQTAQANAKQECVLSKIKVPSVSQAEVVLEINRIKSVHHIYPAAGSTVNPDTKVFGLISSGSIPLEMEYRKADLPTWGGITLNLVAPKYCTTATLGCAAVDIVIARKLSKMCSHISF